MILSYRRATALAFALLVSVDVGCGTALAAGQRSFVSTSGVDNPACSITAPCRAFAAALTATSAGGEIIALDSGGYGPVTIAQSVSIIAAPGVYAGISVLSGHGVTIATAAADTVLLRGLTINNQGSTGRGIFISGAGVVRIENVQVSGFTGASALNATPSDVLQLHIRDSVFRKSNYGIALNYNNPAATMQISGTLVGVEISNNGFDGLGVGNNTVMTLSRSLVIKNNGVGIGFIPAMGQTNHLNVEDCEISENTQGLYPGDASGGTVLQVSRSRIIGNGTGFAIGSNSITRISDNVIENNGYGITLGTGTIETFGNNVVRGNANAEVLPPATSLR